MRLTFTLSTLVLAGAIFIAVFSVRASLLRTLDDALAYWAYDVVANFNRPYRAAQIEAEALRVPGVVAAESWGFQFNLIVVFLLIMAVLIALVGGLGLMGSMSINVFERAREIGVMRAIGASSAAILQIFMVEGVLIGLLSWVAGALIAVPVGKLLSDAVGVSFLQAPLVYTFSWGGALIWLTIVIVLAAVATFWPAWNASRLSVREVLAYE